VASDERRPNHTGEGIEVHFDPERGDLRLSCGQAEFDSLRRAICIEARLENLVSPIERVRYIEIESPRPPQTTIQAAAAWVGGWLILGALMLILGVGTVTMISWVGRILR
jgi:ferric-dicitrate binding protein FerR (iron transport regulator)